MKVGILLARLLPLRAGLVIVLYRISWSFSSLGKTDGAGQPKADSTSEPGILLDHYMRHDGVLLVSIYVLVLRIVRTRTFIGALTTSILRRNVSNCIVRKL